MTDHEHIETLIVARALGGLEPDDALALERDLAAHGPDCADCRRLREEYEEVAGRMAFALAPAPVRAGMEEEILARATIDGAPATTLGSEPPRTVRGVERPRTPQTRAAGAWRTVAAIAAAFVLFAGGWAIGTTLGDDEAPLDLSATRVVPFDAQAGELAVAFEPGSSGVLILGSGVPSPGPGKTYEVWMIDGDTPTPGACVRPGPDGSIAELIDTELGATDTMAITVEPASCSELPTTDPIAVADVA